MGDQWHELSTYFKVNGLPEPTRDDHKFVSEFMWNAPRKDGLPWDGTRTWLMAQMLTMYRIISAARGKQTRTPGTVEVCKYFRFNSCAAHHDAPEGADCNQVLCPSRPTPTLPDYPRVVSHFKAHLCGVCHISICEPNDISMLERECDLSGCPIRQEPKV